MRDIEKIARAMCSEIKGIPTPDALVLDQGKVMKAWQAQEPKVRAAVEAMMEPSEKMKRAGEQSRATDDIYQRRSAEGIFKAMLRAILDEKE